MNEFMHFLPFFTLSEDFLSTFGEIVTCYGLVVTCSLLWVAATLTILNAGFASLPAIAAGCRKEYRSHLNALSAEVSDSPSLYKNCPITLSRIGLLIEMRFGTTPHWDHATMDLLVGTGKSKKKARKALLGEDWLAFVTAVPPAERTQLYKAAVALQQAFAKLEADKLLEHQEYIACLDFTVTTAKWNRETQTWSFSYQMQ